MEKDKGEGDGRIRVETAAEAVALLRPYIGDEAADTLAGCYDSFWRPRGRNDKPERTFASPDTLMASIGPRTGDMLEAGKGKKGGATRISKILYPTGNSLPKSWIDADEWRLEGV